MATAAGCAAGGNPVRGGVAERADAAECAAVLDGVAQAHRASVFYRVADAGRSRAGGLKAGHSRGTGAAAPAPVWLLPETVVSPARVLLASASPRGSVRSACGPVGPIEVSTHASSLWLNMTNRRDH